MSKEKTPKQNRTLNWLLGEAGLSDDDARDYLEATCGKRYRRDMDFYDYRKCIDDLAAKTGKMPGMKQPAPAAAAQAEPVEIPYKADAVTKILAQALPKQKAQSAEHLSKADPATPEQVTFIRELVEGMGGGPHERGEFIKKQIGYRFARTVGEAQGIIEALKKMRARGYRFEKNEGDKQKKRGGEDVK